MLNILLLYIVRFLHQTTTDLYNVFLRAGLYIVRFLHQTTTYVQLRSEMARCISSVSYIKPQPIITNKLYTNMLLIFLL